MYNPVTRLVFVALAGIFLAIPVSVTYAGDYDITLDEVFLWVDKTVVPVGEEFECWAWCAYTVDLPGGEDEEHEVGEGGDTYVKEIYEWTWGQGAHPTALMGDWYYEVYYSEPGYKTIEVQCTVELRLVDTDELLASDGPKSTNVQVTVVGVDKLQYRIGSGQYQDVPDPLYVAKGTTVDFKALKDPSDAPQWPSGKPVWGGSSGGSGTGETTSVAFNTASTSSIDYKTVTAECGNTVTANVLVCKCDIIKNAEVITNLTQNVPIGRRIYLTGRVLPDGISVTHSWSVPGTVVADYQANANSATVTPLTQLTNATVDFYWVAASSGAVVTYTATMAGGSSFTANTTFNVLGPTFTVTTATGTVTIGSSWGNLQMSCGTPATPGIRFSRSTPTFPTGWIPAWTWQTQWVQVVQSTTRRKQFPEGNWIRLSGSGVCDKTYPYGSGDEVNDSPSTSLSEDYVRATASDSYSMYLMFKPGGTAIWVPRQLVSWSWTGDASGSGTNWTLNSSTNPSPSVSSCSTHPTWNGNVTGLHFLPE